MAFRNELHANFQAIGFRSNTHNSKGTYTIMAQQTSITYSDDIDGGKAVETIAFALDGAQYEIDLNAKNAKHLRKALAEFVEAGRKVRSSDIADRPTRTNRTQPSVNGAGKAELAAIRAWATATGIPVAARGRVSQDVKEQYAAANASGNEV